MGVMTFIKSIWVVLAVVSTLALVILPQAAVADTVSKQAAFLNQVFNNEPVSKPQTLWLTKGVKQELKGLFDYEIGVLRVRYQGLLAIIRQTVEFLPYSHHQ
ncbi:hypothetical protein [Marinagarivorans cellulosilyticus]|uniref:Uncharacterized protein n=1 Tax=Marinagarivorans cellulosilyticus TaxID=2721545 RepID=A0AAN1WI90_9GAMM|nr:hypothetical protein [Marinagarivorans cellulosilyticus]BCD98092.1 hypothetical protein MARGE09_P2293 [Marinagarivorans cellulosilyticus]